MNAIELETRYSAHNARRSPPIEIGANDLELRSLNMRDGVREVRAQESGHDY
jgi:hypothetical protein